VSATQKGLTQRDQSAALDKCGNDRGNEMKFLFVWIVVALIGVGGWIANIVKLIGMNFEPITGMAVGRVVGVFVPPLGAILGFF